MRLYIIRHGENQANIDHVMSYKIVDHPLTPRGVEQAQHLAVWLAGKNIARIYSSPLKRAQQTAEIVAQRLDIPDVTLIEDLRELHVGVLDGRGDEAAWQIHDDIIRKWANNEAGAMFEGGEDMHILKTRIGRALEQILAENSDLPDEQAIAVVAHGGLLNFGLWWLCGNVTIEQRQAGLANTAVVTLDANPGVYNCVAWGTTAHLSQA